MATFELYPIGQIDFPPTQDGYWDFQVELPVGITRLVFEIDEMEMTLSLLDKVRPFVTEIEHYDRLAMAAIRADYENSDSSSHLYLHHHAEELDAAERSAIFGVEDAKAVGIEHLLKSLQLHSMRLYPELESRIAELDYTIGQDITQYVLMVVFNSIAGDVIEIVMES